MIPTVKICQIWEVFRDVIDKKRNIASICFIGDYGQTKPMMKNGLIDKLKDKRDQYIIGVWDRIFSNNSNFIQFSTIQRITSTDAVSEIRA